MRGSLHFFYVQSISGATDSEMTFLTTTKLQILIHILYVRTYYILYNIIRYTFRVTFYKFFQCQKG